ncbi:MAG: hypothetical protein JNL11_01680 [Bdellovibrionaceae bacterium]|nr:hypothetical protein [Pseudobdellovibrionaceae bacterium]
MCLLLSVLTISCQKSNDSFSLLSEQSTFQQGTSFQPRKIDILWVIDNSGSMETSQNNVISNFNSFIQRFKTLNYDFNMAFISTDAYLDITDTSGAYKNIYCPAFDKKCSVFRDGPGRNPNAQYHSGTPIISRLTRDITSVFNLNAAQGIQGYGDERAFQSFKAALQNQNNTGFRRPDAYLAIIIVSDEDDFSQNNMTPALESIPNNGYLNDSRLHSVNSYVQFLNNYTHSTENLKNYSVSAITILDQDCLANLNTTFARRLGTRYVQIADQTGGTKASLCGNFGESLQLISDTVLSLTSAFRLDREPIPETLVVIVNGDIVSQDANNGWTYDPSNLTVNFHGTAIPNADAAININFDPVTVK